MSKEKEYISFNPKELSEHFKEEGNKFFFKKAYDIASIYFTKAIDMDPQNSLFYANSIVLINLGSACYLARGLYNQALKDSLKCIELDKEFMKVYFYNI
jgi:tetratricopeptide (TPR) repeat protein